MQKLVTLAAIVMLLTQVILLCLQREANTWTFSLVTRAVVEPATAWKAIDTLFVEHKSSMDTNTTLPASLHEDLSPAAVACLQDAWRTYRPHVPVHCAVRVHNGFKLREVLASWNPHLLLLALCCVHVTCCLRRTMPEHKNALRCIIFAMAALNLGMGLYQNTQSNSGGFQYPTIVGIIFCFAACFYYVHMAPTNAMEDPYWEIVFHLQAVGAPLVTLVFVSMGVRFWDDALYHLFSLLAACNCLWLQRVAVKKDLNKLLCGVVTIGLTTSSLLLMRHQLQADANVEQWQPMVAHMSLLVVVPIYVMAWTRTNAAQKFPLHLTQLCVSAALLATVFNLAMF